MLQQLEALNNHVDGTEVLSYLYLVSPHHEDRTQYTKLAGEQIIFYLEGVPG